MCNDIDFALADIKVSFSIGLIQTLQHYTITILKPGLSPDTSVTSHTDPHPEAQILLYVVS